MPHQAPQRRRAVGFFESARSIAFDDVEQRLHAIEAVPVPTLDSA